MTIDDRLLESKPWIGGILGRSQDPISQDAASRINARVDLWLRQRLWSINLAPELVLHDDRHVAQVDRLASELSDPLLGQPGGLTPLEAELLSCAAWLHDWGHVGGLVGLSTKGAQVFATAPQDVRIFHGMISRQLLDPKWKGMHGIADPSLASAVGVLCAHHQGRSSFGLKEGLRGTVSDGYGGLHEVQPTSLASALSEIAPLGGAARISLERAKVLIALLRVADACDLGIHRVPDGESAKGAFLARCIQSQTWRAIGQVEIESLRWGVAHPTELRPALEAVISEAGRCAELRNHVSDAGHVVADILRRLKPFAKDSPAVEVLGRYVAFTTEQSRYYREHRAVRLVQFELSPDRTPLDTVGWTVAVVVSPNPPTTDLEAMRIVRTDLRSELIRGEGAESVREVLLRAGLRFDLVRSPGRAEPIYI